MKLYVSLLLTLLSGASCFSQTYRPPINTTPTYGETLPPRGFSNYKTNRQEKVFVISGIPYTTYNLVVSQTEKDIIELEARECEALVKNDTMELRRLWVRDFTLNQNQSTLVESKSALPRYMAVRRSVDKLSIMDPNTVTTSGTEGYQEIREGKMESGTRPYFHTWMRKNNMWKLTTKGE